jgi:hypothetical protein
MKIIVDTWSGYEIRGVVVFDTETMAVSSPITQDDDDPRKDCPCVFPEATSEQFGAYRKAINKIYVGDMVEVVTGRKAVGTVGMVTDKFTFVPTGTYGHGATDYVVIDRGMKIQAKHCKIVTVRIEGAAK